MDTVKTIRKSFLFPVFHRVKSLIACKEEGKQLNIRIFSSDESAFPFFNTAFLISTFLLQFPILLI